MEFITQYQFNSLEVLSSYRGSRKADPLIQQLRDLSIGSGAIIKKEEWGRKSKLTTANINFKNHKFTVRTLADKSGWAVLRIQ